MGARSWRARMRLLRDALAGPIKRLEIATNWVYRAATTGGARRQSGKCSVEGTKVLIREMLGDIGMLGVYEGFDARGFEADLQGCEAYDHPYFEALIAFKR
jgi:hypothetical protein